MVNVHYLLAKGTSDDYVWQKIKDKLDVLEKAGLNDNTFDNCESREIPAEPGQKNTLLNMVFDQTIKHSFANHAKRTTPMNCRMLS